MNIRASCFKVIAIEFHKFVGVKCISSSNTAEVTITQSKFIGLHQIKLDQSDLCFANTPTRKTVLKLYKAETF